MSRVDAYYTPHSVATELLSNIDLTYSPLYIADFAVGDGSLLVPASKVWPLATVIANDICDSTINTLSLTNPNWITNKIDFLNNESIDSGCLDGLELLKAKIDLILLNPPFSCRGSKRVTSYINIFEVSCSIALGFIINSLKFLSQNGECLAILPSSCFTSEKDTRAIKLLNEFYNVNILKNLSNKTFKECSVKTVLVKFTKKKVNNCIADYTVQKEIINDIGSELRIFRGKLRVYEVENKLHKRKSKKLVPFVHTTNIIKGTFVPSDYIEPSSFITICGAIILIPRVGNPKREKILILNTPSIIISDCLFAIMFESFDTAFEAYNKILNDWDNLKSLYIGTCAQYVTVERLTNYLNYILKVDLELQSTYNDYSLA